VGAVNGRAAASRGSQPVPVTAERHALRTMIIDMVAPVAVYYAARALGRTVWVALIAGGIVSAIGRVCTVIWGSAILADAVVRVVMAYTLPIGLVPALGGALWPVTFISLQFVTNVYFARSGFWRILRTGAAAPGSR